MKDLQKEIEKMMKDKTVDELYKLKDMLEKMASKVEDKIIEIEPEPPED